jgi:phage virion morphogenesis protein
MEIDITIKDKALSDALRQAARVAEDMRPLLNAIGETVTRQTFERFKSEGPAPDGTPWKKLKDATVERKRKRKKSEKILRESGILGDTIAPQMPDSNTVVIGTNSVYGRVHQMGYKEKNIPARPYLGLSAENTQEIMRIMENYVNKIANRIGGK